MVRVHVQPGTMKRVTAFIVDFLFHFRFWFLVALLTGAPTTNNEGLAFNLTGPRHLLHSF